MLAPLAALMVTDYFLTVFAYHYSFVWTAYVTTWAWYLAVMALGYILLKSKTTWLRVGAAAVLGPTSFCLISNYAVWVMSSHTVWAPANVSAYLLWLDHLLCGRDAVLSQRPALNRDRRRPRLRRSRARPQDAHGAQSKRRRGPLGSDRSCLPET